MCYGSLKTISYLSQVEIQVEIESASWVGKRFMVIMMPMLYRHDRQVVPYTKGNGKRGAGNEGSRTRVNLLPKVSRSQHVKSHVSVIVFKSSYAISRNGH